MAYRSRYPMRRTMRRPYFRRFARMGGTRFQGRRFTSRVNGREVPYYLGRGIEAHVFDSPITHASVGANTAAASSVSSTLLNPLNRGTGIFDRESQRASMKYLLLRLRYQINQTTISPAGGGLSTGPVTVRCILVYSTRPLAALNVADFLTTPSNATTDFATAGVQRIDSRENFQILYDNKFVIRNTNTQLVTSPPQPIAPTGDFTFRDLDLRIPIRRPVSFTASSVSNITLSDITSGALFLVTIFDNATSPTATAAGAYTTGEGSARLVFAP